MASAEDKLKQIIIANDKLIWKTDTTDSKNCHEQFRSWFLQQFTQSSPTCTTPKRNNCSLDDFAVYFLNAIRQQTEIHFRSQDSETPKCSTPIHTFKSSTDIIGSLLPEEKDASLKKTPFDSTPELQATRNDSNNIKYEELFCTSYNTSRSSSTLFDSTTDRGNSLSYYQSDTSTPVSHRSGNQKRFGNNFETPNSHDRQTRNSSATSSICLGDFILLNSSSRTNKKRASQSLQYVGSIETPDTRKPKKRVVPTTISSRSANEYEGSIAFGSVNSSYSNENNFLKFANQEIDDKTKCSIMEARKSLKFNAIEISKELEKSNVRSKPCVSQSLGQINLGAIHESNNTAAAVSKSHDVIAPIDFSEITNRNLLQCLAHIYSILIDLNFATNVLNEIAFLLNLLNALPEHQNQQSTLAGTIDNIRANNATVLNKNHYSTETTEGIDALHNFCNCIFFATRVLVLQRHVLLLLDAKSLSVILNNKRICYFDDELKLSLDSIYQRKLQIDAQKSLHDSTSIRFDRSFKNVYYREDKDSRQNFTSNNEFGAFKSQRDLFYKALKIWEANHLNPTWSFSAKITPKIRDIFRQSENPVNMAHFAKLFVSQLLISSSDATSPEEIGLEVDLQKFSRLTQRLVAPSNFSVNYQFPRNQAFYRDFIEEARSIPFSEQLKISLYSELITLNDSTFEQLNICKKGVRDDDDEDEAASQNEGKEFVVRPEVLSSMIILAKFLGYVTAQPFQQQQSSGSTTSIHGNVEKKQIVLRSLFQPNFNTCRLLQQAIKNGKLLITLPWLVQYLAMLDNVTLQLDSFVKATQIMFSLYMNLEMEALHLLPTSVFIIRCCLGWLFDTKQIIAEQYYNHRACHHMKITTEDITEGMQEINILIPSDLAEELPTDQLCLSNLKRDKNGSFACVLQKQRPFYKSSPKGADAATASLQLNPILESYLNVACPFLAEFRVSIMPAKYAMTKYVSRTGRYRYITTRIAELSTKRDATINSGSENENITRNSMKGDQTKLIEAFLHSQNSSMRRLIEFVIERIYKSVVKDAQYKILLPSKAAADAKVNQITSSDHKEVAKVVSAIYAEARTDAFQQWDITVAKSMDERIEKGLDALLPAETAPAIKETYNYLIRRNAAQKVHQWHYANMLKNNFYCQDLNEMTQKICKVNKKLQNEPETLQSSELKIVKAMPSVSDLIDDLQYWLHCTSMRSDLVATAEPIIEYLQRLPHAFENTLPTVFYRLIGTGIVQLLQHIIVRHPLFISKDILNAACNVWLQQRMQCGPANTKHTKTKTSSYHRGSDDYSYDKESIDNDSTSKVPNIFDSLITISFIESLGVSHVSYQKLTELLVEMIKQHVISIDYVNGLIMVILKEDWTADKLNKISNMLQKIAKETASIKSNYENAYNDEENNDGADDGKSHLFMEVLADFSRDIDNF